MTTAFAHAMHGHLIEAVRANPFGFMVFAMTVGWMPIATYGVWRGVGVIEMLDRMRIDRWGLFVVAASMLTWGVRIATMLWSR